MDIHSSKRSDRLSVRQRQCLDLVGHGFTSKEIGRQLGLSPSTIDNHVRSAMERLDVSDRAAAARAIREQGEEPVTPAPNVDSGLPRSPFLLPPLGGELNLLSMRRRVWHIVQIALLGVMGMAAAVFTIAGLVHLFTSLMTTQ